MLARLRTVGPPDGPRSAVRVEHILSGRIDQPVEFLQTHDEWVVVLSGAATLVIDDRVHHMGTGDWVCIEGGTPHQLRAVAPGTSWLAVHAGG